MLAIKSHCIHFLQHSNIYPYRNMNSVLFLVDMSGPSRQRLALSVSFPSKQNLTLYAGIAEITFRWRSRELGALFHGRITSELKRKTITSVAYSIPTRVHLHSSHSITIVNR